MEKFIDQLQIVCRRKNLPQPVYSLITEVGPPHSKSFTYECRVQNKRETGTASTKALSKHLAAKNMIDKIILFSDEKSDSSSTPKQISVTNFSDTSERASASNFSNISEATTHNFIKDPEPLKTLQKICSANKFPQPSFIMKNEEGPPHDKRFSFECTVGTIVEVAKGRSKTFTKHLAAAKILKKLESNSSPLLLNTSDIKYSTTIDENIDDLMMLCSRKCLLMPEYILKEKSGSVQVKKFTSECCVSEIVESVTAHSKTESKQTFCSNVKYLELLQSLCSTENFPTPIFNLIDEEGPSHNKIFTYECKIDDLVVTASGSSKNQAKHFAVKEMLDKLINFSLIGFEKMKIIETSSQTLIKYCSNNGLAFPVYRVVENCTDSHVKNYMVECLVEDVIETASSYSKKVAKHLASEKMLKTSKSRGKILVPESNLTSINMNVLKVYANSKLVESRKFPTPEVVEFEKCFSNNPSALKIIKDYNESEELFVSDVVKKVCSLVTNTDICIKFEQLQSWDSTRIFICVMMPNPYFVTFGMGPHAKQISAHKMMCLLKLLYKNDCNVLV